MNEFINKFKLISPTNKSVSDNLVMKMNIEPKKKNSPIDKSKSESNNRYYYTISSKNSDCNHEFSKPFHIYDNWNKVSVNSKTEIKEFNVKNKLYPDLANLSFKTRFHKLFTRKKITETNEENSKLNFQKRPKHIKTKTQTEIYSSMNISNTFNEKDFDIPFVNKKSRLLSSKPLMTEQDRILEKVDKSQIFYKKAAFRNQKSVKTKSLINTWMKKINTTGSMEFSTKLLNDSSGNAFFNNSNNVEFLNQLQAEKKKLIKNILKNQSFTLVNFAFPTKNSPMSKIEHTSSSKSFRYFL